MSAPTFQIDETNGAGATVTGNVPSTQFASTDTASASSVSQNNPVAQGSNSFEKWQRVKVTGVATTAIISLSVYYPGTQVEDNAGSTSTVSLKFGVNGTYATPTASSSSVATTAATSATSAPGTTVNAPANTVNAYSGYVTEQLQTTGSAAGGPCIFSSPYRTFQYVWD